MALIRTIKLREGRMKNKTKQWINEAIYKRMNGWMNLPAVLIKCHHKAFIFYTRNWSMVSEKLLNTNLELSSLTSTHNSTVPWHCITSFQRNFCFRQDRKTKKKFIFPPEKGPQKLYFVSWTPFRAKKKLKLPEFSDATGYSVGNTKNNEC